MGQIPSLKLRPTTRVGNYQVLRWIGRGWEGEVYEVEEVPAEAKRAMKIIPIDPGPYTGPFKRTVRDFVHYAWFFEKLGPTQSVVKYYSMFHHFFPEGTTGYQNSGVFCFIFEKVEGETLKKYVKKTSENPLTTQQLSL